MDATKLLTAPQNCQYTDGPFDRDFSRNVSPKLFFTYPFAPTQIAPPYSRTECKNFQPVRITLTIVRSEGEEDSWRSQLPISNTRLL